MQVAHFRSLFSLHEAIYLALLAVMSLHSSVMISRVEINPSRDFRYTPAAFDMCPCTRYAFAFLAKGEIKEARFLYKITAPSGALLGAVGF